MPENQPSLEATEVENITVQKQSSPGSTTVGSKEFCETIAKELADGKVWRTSKALSDKLNVDVVEMDAFLQRQQTICSRPSKEEGVFLYALVSRVEAPKAKESPPSRPLVTEEDRYALASLHCGLRLIEETLQKYAMKIHDRNPEAFTQLVAGKDKLEAGIVLLAVRLKADLSKLPR